MSESVSKPQAEGASHESSSVSANPSPPPSATNAMRETARELRRQGRSRWRALVDQLGTILLSLALAVVIWLIAVSQANPLVTEQFPERLPIVVRGLDPDLQSVQDLSRESVRVGVRAPRAAWDDLEASGFNVSIDLSQLGEGTSEVPISVVPTDPRVTVLQVNPPSIRVQLDPVASRVFTVSVAVMDSPAFGYDYGAPLVEPPTVTVRGPASQVELVSAVTAPVNLLNAKSQVERTVAVQAINRQNQEVSGVDLDTSFTHVVIPVEQWPGRKEVAVRIDLEGQPANGYRLSSVRAEPSNVVLQGRAELLATVPGYIETEPLSIEGATSDIRTRLALVVPPDVTVFNDNTVEAVVNITAVEGGTTARMRPIIQGLSPGLAATFSPETVDVILSGPIPALEGLDSDDIFALLDLSGLLPGTHVVKPRIALPESITEGGIIPETVEVVITALETPTPTPEPTDDESGDAPTQSVIESETALPATTVAPTAQVTPVTATPEASPEAESSGVAPMSVPMSAPESEQGGTVPALP